MGSGRQQPFRCSRIVPTSRNLMFLATDNGFRMWWPGTDLNRRRQPFQGCALPTELPGHGSCGEFLHCNTGSAFHLIIGSHRRAFAEAARRAPPEPQQHDADRDQPRRQAHPQSHRAQRLAKTQQRAQRQAQISSTRRNGTPSACACRPRRAGLRSRSLCKPSKS